VWPRTTR